MPELLASGTPPAENPPRKPSVSGPHLLGALASGTPVPGAPVPKQSLDTPVSLGKPQAGFAQSIALQQPGQIDSTSKLIVHTESQETTGGIVEPEPVVAETLFGSRIGLARQFADDLATHGENLGLIGPQELSRLWSRHIVNSVLLAPLIRPGRVGDIGSGAGLPGLVLAIARPDAHFILIEPMERRADWLRREVDALELNNVEILRARAEEAKFSPWLDQVTARAVSALSKLIPLTVPLVRSGGELLFLKGAGVVAEAESAAKVIKRLRLTNLKILTLGEGVVSEPTRVFRATVD